MERRRLGRSGLQVPVIGMGTWKTFDVVDAKAEQARRKIVNEAIRVGASFFDTSPMYGEAERVLGAALAGQRDRAIVATKVWASAGGVGQEQIRRSLEFFQGQVEVFQIHNLSAWELFLPILEEMRSRGETCAVGITHYSHSAFPEIIRIMSSGRVDAIQIPYNPTDRAVEREILPLSAELDIGVIIMRPLGVGELVHKPPPKAKWQHLSGYGVHTWAQVLLKWIVSDPRVHVAIPATSKSGRMTENAAAGDPPWFDADQRAEIAQLAAQYA